MVNRRINNGILELRNDEIIVMTIEEKVENDEMLIFVTGEIKNEVAHEFEDEIMTAFSVMKKIRIDLSKATYMSSLALRALLSLQQMIDVLPDSKMIISGVIEQVKQVFVESGFYDILYIEE